MKRFPSIKKNSDFQNIYRNGKSYANRLLVMYVMRNGEESNQLGISVSKKVGNSVVRHHIARLIGLFLIGPRKPSGSGSRLLQVFPPSRERTSHPVQSLTFRPIL